MLRNLRLGDYLIINNGLEYPRLGRVTSISDDSIVINRYLGTKLRLPIRYKLDGEFIDHTGGVLNKLIVEIKTVDVIDEMQYNLLKDSYTIFKA